MIRGFQVLGLAMCMAIAASAYPTAKKKEDEPTTKTTVTRPAPKRAPVRPVAPKQTTDMTTSVEPKTRPANPAYAPSTEPNLTLTKSEKDRLRREANRTKFKTQNDEFMNTHEPGRIYDLNNGEYKSGQENKVYVDEHTRSDGTHVNGHKRSYPGGKRKKKASPLDFDRHTRGNTVPR